MKFEGIANSTALFVEQKQLIDTVLWKKFVNQFRIQMDGPKLEWRGEFWGKMMRAGALVYEYTKSSELYDILTSTIRDIITVAEPDGRVSSYSRDTEFDGWDLWCRKYVILGSIYYLDICKDADLKKELINFISRCADYIMLHIGPGKKSITSASRSWLGLNSSSILEPIVKLYKLTGDKKYLDFATYIVDCGGAEGVNVFELAYKNELYPYQYGVAKAYEMTSCFEGLLEYYLVTGIEKYKTAVTNFAYAVLESEVSIIGSCGVTHELFDHTRTRQTVRYDGVMQETCVTVTWMKFCSRVLELTDDPAFADAMEQSFYNAYLASLNTELCESPYVFNKFKAQQIEAKSTFLPFDSYCPLTPGKRGQKVGGNRMLEDNTYYGCCACIGGAGIGVFLKSAVTCKDDVLTVNFFETGSGEFEINGVPVTLTVKTDYPVSGKIKINISAASPVSFTLRVRSPKWSEQPSGYMLYTKTWHNDSVELDFAMPIKLHFPEHWDEDLVYIDGSKMTALSHTSSAQMVYHKPEDDNFFAVTRGPLTLAADDRLGKPANSVFVPTFNSKPVEVKDGSCLLKFEFFANENYTLIDYASAGKDWKSDIAAWLPTK